MPKSQTPDLVEILRQAIENAQSRFWTALPGRVESYDETAQRASVQPLVKNIYYDENEERVAERLPMIGDVPVMFIGPGGARITFPLSKGDTGLLVFTSCSLDKWLTGDGREVDPFHERRNHLGDAIFIPGLFAKPPTSAPTNAMVVHVNQLLLGGDDASDPIVRKSDLQGIYDALTNATTGAGYGADVQSRLDIAYPSGLTASPVVRSK